MLCQECHERHLFVLFDSGGVHLHHAGRQLPGHPPRRRRCAAPRQAVVQGGGGAVRGGAVSGTVLSGVPDAHPSLGVALAAAVAADLDHLRSAAEPLPGAAGCGWRRTMPPSCTDPVSRGWNGSATSYCLSSPVPQQDTYSQRSSTDRSMSETRGGTAPNGLRAGGSRSGSAGSAGMVTTWAPTAPASTRSRRSAASWSSRPRSATGGPSLDHSGMRRASTDRYAASSGASGGSAARSTEQGLGERAERDRRVRRRCPASQDLHPGRPRRRLELEGQPRLPHPGLSPDEDEAAPALSGLVERGMEEVELLVTPHDNRTQDLPHAVSIVGWFPRSHWSVRASNRRNPPPTAPRSRGWCPPCSRSRTTSGRLPIAAASAWVNGARRRAGRRSDQELLAAIA
jgi:hypothetical protein